MKKNKVILLTGVAVVIVILLFSIVLLCVRHTHTTVSSDTGPENPAAENPLSSGLGKVKILNCAPDQYTVYSKIAAAFTEETGIRVDILTVATGDCESALPQLLQQDDAPTILCLHSEKFVNDYRDCLYDLSGSALVNELCSPKFGLTVDNRILAVPACVEGFGLIYNASLLARSGYTRTDIQDFGTLQAVSQYITDHRDFSAFSPLDFSDFTLGKLSCLLSGTLHDEAHLKSFWDLCIANSPKNGSALQSFVDEKSVFYVGSTADYNKVAAIGSNNLDILPAFYDGGGKLQCISDNYWAINARSSDADIQASLQFLLWMVTKSEDAPAPVDQLALLAPYKDASYAANSLERQLRKYINDPDELENISVSWDPYYGGSDEYLQEVRVALEAYTTTPDNLHWKNVADLLHPASSVH